MRRHFRVLVVLALTQIAGWGMIGVLPVIAPRVASEFGISLSSVFLGTSFMFVAMVLAAPWAGRAFRRFGSREVMTVGAGAIGLGLGLLALSPNLAVFVMAWVTIGLAGALFLTTGAYAYIASYADDGARSLIGTLMAAIALNRFVTFGIDAVGIQLLKAMGMDLAPGFFSPLGEALGRPQLKLVTKADKSDLGADAGVSAKRLRKDDASVAVDREDLNVAVERDRQLVSLVRIVRQAREKPIDFLRKSLAACIEGWSVERGVTVDAAGVSVTLEDVAEGCGDRDAALGVDLVRECRDKAVHPLVGSSANAVLDALHH